MAKKVGVLGSGIVGITLANGFVKHGYEVMIGTHDISKRETLRQKTNASIATGSFAEAAGFGDLVVLAVKGSAALKVLELAGKTNLEGKTVIDTTNPIADAPPDHGVLKFFTTPDRSLMEQLQEAAPGAHFVKSFSIVGNAKMVDPVYENNTRPTMFICGDHEEAKSAVIKILEAFGWESMDMGGVQSARAIEPLCILWCIPGFFHNQWNHAFKLLVK